jgi:chaperonin GroES
MANTTYDPQSDTISFDDRPEPKKLIGYDIDDEQGLQEDQDSVPIRSTRKLTSSQNIAELLTETELGMISRKCLEGLEEDKRSMKEWLDNAEKALELTKIDYKEKNLPFRKAANIKYPLVTTASQQWSSRFLSEMIRNGKLATYKIIGNDLGLTDPKSGQLVIQPGFKLRKGKRITQYLNWQILEKSPRWMTTTESLLAQLTIVGTCFKKVWFDPIEKCVKSSLCGFDRVFVNNSIECLDKAPRITEYFDLTTNDIIKYIRHELYCDFDVYTLPMDKSDYDAIYHECIEQHCWLDLDGDGFEEPYIVTIHCASEKVMRIVARYREQDVEKNSKGQIKTIHPENYYIDYHFIRSCDNTFFSLGFGTLLLNHNNTINTILNQLVDAGHLACMQGGLINKGIRMKSGQMVFDPGEWKIVEATAGTDLKNNIFPFQYKEPSQVLFMLVQYLIESAEKLSATTDALTGTQDATNASPNTMLQLVQQSLVVHTALFRRVFRAEKEELKRWMELNSQHLNVEEYLTIVDPSPQEMQEMFVNGKLQDFNLTAVDVIPVVDLNESTVQESMMKAQAMNQAALQWAQVTQGQAVKGNATLLRFYQSLDIDNPEQLIVPDPQPGQDTPQSIQIKLQQANMDSQLKLKAEEVEAKKGVSQSKIKLQDAQAVKALSDADNAKAKTQLDVYKTALEHQQAKTHDAVQLHKIDTDAQLKTDSNISTHILGHAQHQTQKDIAHINAASNVKNQLSTLPTKEEVRAEAEKRGFKSSSTSGKK